MKNLLKYEFRKSRSGKLIVFLAAMVFELCFLLGIFLPEAESLWVIGMMGLVLTASFGIFMIGLLSVVNLHSDLNTKQSYMLFMTPNSGYKIIGAKVLENGISLFASGLLFGLLASADLVLMAAREGDLMSMINTVLNNFDISLGPKQIFWAIAVVLLSWLATITMAFFSVTLQTAVFNGRRFSALLGIVIFIALNMIVSALIHSLNGLIPDASAYVSSVVWMIVFAAVTAVLYFLSGWITETKLSV